jgi:hypothetical protein
LFIDEALLGEELGLLGRGAEHTLMYTSRTSKVGRQEERNVQVVPEQRVTPQILKNE